MALNLHPRQRLVGPPTLGARGDPLGSAFIGIQVYNMIPDLLAVLDHQC